MTPDNQILSAVDLTSVPQINIVRDVVLLCRMIFGDAAVIGQNEMKLRRFHFFDDLISNKI